MIPKKFHKHGLASLQLLATNQKRLVMGFDLYHTMMRLMTQAYELTPHAHVPEWSYDALKDVVSHDRTCAEARIPSSYCLCMEEQDIKYTRPRFTTEEHIGNVTTY